MNLDGSISSINRMDEEPAYGVDGDEAGPPPDAECPVAGMPAERPATGGCIMLNIRRTRSVPEGGALGVVDCSMPGPAGPGRMGSCDDKMRLDLTKRSCRRKAATLASRVTPSDAAPRAREAQVRPLLG